MNAFCHAVVVPQQRKINALSFGERGAHIRNQTRFTAVQHGHGVAPKRAPTGVLDECLNAFLLIGHEKFALLHECVAVGVRETLVVGVKFERHQCHERRGERPALGQAIGVVPAPQIAILNVAEEARHRFRRAVHVLPREHGRTACRIDKDTVDGNVVERVLCRLVMVEHQRRGTVVVLQTTQRFRFECAVEKEHGFVAQIAKVGWVVIVERSVIAELAKFAFDDPTRREPVTTAGMVIDNVHMNGLYVGVRFRNDGREGERHIFAECTHHTRQAGMADKKRVIAWCRVFSLKCKRML